MNLSCEVRREHPERDAAVLTIQAGSYESRITTASIAPAWDALSHHPEARARLELEALAHNFGVFAGTLAAIRTAGGTVPDSDLERFAKKHVALWRTAWAADARCASSFIVGPARFPVRTMEKRQGWADRHRQRITEHLAAARKAVQRVAFPHGWPGGPIQSNHPEAVALLRDEIEKKQKRHAFMLAVNAAVRKAGKNADSGAVAAAIIQATGCDEAQAHRLAVPNCFGARGFESFELTNSNARIKRLQDRLAELVKVKAAPATATTHETTAGAVEVRENPDAARIQLLFPGKPSERERAVLKAHGFRWAPSEGAWQRHLNNAGRHAVACVLRKLAPAAASEPTP